MFIPFMFFFYSFSLLLYIYILKIKIISTYTPFYILYITLCDTFIQTYYHKVGVVYMQNYTALMLW